MYTFGKSLRLKKNDFVLYSRLECGEYVCVVAHKNYH